MMKIKQEKDEAAARGGGPHCDDDVTAEQEQTGGEGAPEQVCGDRLSQEGGEASTGALRWEHLWTAS